MPPHKAVGPGDQGGEFKCKVKNLVISCYSARIIMLLNMFQRYIRSVKLSLIAKYELFMCFFMQQVSFVASVLLCLNSCFFLFVSVEILLDMSASGSELGWLTMPFENGVSIYTSTGIFKTSG